MSESEIPPGQVLIYHDGATQLQVRLDGETVWLTQQELAELYQTTKQNVSQHLNNVFREGELLESRVVKEFFTAASDGKKYRVKYYNLEAILAIGYRVRSSRGIEFRRWATDRLSELLHKGFTLDDERIKAGKTIGHDYFDELLERVRDIRASERLFYQKITDIYATSIDYDPQSDACRSFFATVQNKLHWAVHGQTAAEMIEDRANGDEPNMGLTTWKNVPSGPIRRRDVTIAKNYLSQEELQELNRIVTMYLDYAEDQARRHSPMHMSDWASRLDAFLHFNERNILSHAGKISHELAAKHAAKEYDRYERDRLQATGETIDELAENVSRIGKGKESE